MAILSIPKEHSENGNFEIGERYGKQDLSHWRLKKRFSDSLLVSGERSP